MIPIVIPVYKKPEQVTKCVDALNKQTVKVQVVKVDDSDTSEGFTKTVNRGLKAVLRERLSTEYVIVLNQDCYFRPDTAEKLVDFMETHPQCAVAGPKQLSSQNEDRIIWAGSGDAWPMGMHVMGFKSKGDCTVSKQTPWVNGACMIIRLDALQECGLLDENFKMLGSDSDWCYTARARGWECWYCADTEVVHEQGVSAGKNPQLGKTFELDMLLWRDKWIGSELYRELSMELFR